MDGEALTFDNEFDGVFSNAALHWMTRPERVIAGVAGALKPNGRFVAEFGGHGNVAAISTALPPIQSNLVKPIALLSTRRAAVLPELPTALEQGLADVDADGWNALFLPRGTPEPIVHRLNAAVGDALSNPALSRRMEELGLTVPPPERRTPEHLARLLRAEIEKWGPPIKASGISAD